MTAGVYLSIRFLRAVVVAAVIIDNHFSIFIVEAGGRDQLPTTAVLRQVIAGQRDGWKKARKRMSTGEQKTDLDTKMTFFTFISAVFKLYSMFIKSVKTNLLTNVCC